VEQNLKKTHRYNATLIRVVDGDTIDAMIDLGFDIWVKKRIRLFGINAPESRTRDLEEKKSGLSSKKKLTELLEDAGGKFILASEGVGKFGRCLGVIYIGEININDLLLKEGYAEKY
jgi:micrococcal nuclease